DGLGSTSAHRGEPAPVRAACREPPHERGADRQDRGALDREQPGRERVAPGRQGVLDRERPGRVGRPMDGPPESVADPLAKEARESTRLNSSHVAISYAVFCLKKKNT